MPHLRMYTIRVYAPKEEAYDIKRIRYSEALAEARKHLLTADRVVLLDPDGNIIYQHRKPHLKRFSVLEAVK
jgi:hypothetical protein